MADVMQVRSWTPLQVNHDNIRTMVTKVNKFTHIISRYFFLQIVPFSVVPACFGLTYSTNLDHEIKFFVLTCFSEF